MDKYNASEEADTAIEAGRKAECTAKITKILDEYSYDLHPSVTLIVTNKGIVQAGSIVELVPRAIPEVPH